MEKNKTASGGAKLSMIELKDIVQDCNINFLTGAGLSTPYLSLLGQVEKWNEAKIQQTIFEVWKQK